DREGAGDRSAARGDQVAQAPARLGAGRAKEARAGGRKFGRPPGFKRTGGPNPTPKPRPGSRGPGGGGGGGPPPPPAPAGPAQVLGVVAPSGGGKPPRVRVLVGPAHPTGGSASLCGLPARDPESRRRVGYLPEGHRFPGYLTARQTLSVFGQMSGLDRATLRR